MNNIKELNKQKYLERIFELHNPSSGSVSAFNSNFPVTSVPIEYLVRSEIKKQLAPIKETQEAIVNQFAEISIEQEAIKDEISNLRKIYSENYQLRKKLENINNLLSFKKFQANWNGYDAQPFAENVIQKSIEFINSPKLRFQPSVFPTARESIQFEYEKPNGNYLEIEIFEDKYSAYLEIDKKEYEKDSISLDEIIKLVDEFYSRI